MTAPAGILLLALASLEPPGADLARDLGRAEAAMESWDLVRAREIAERILKRSPEALEARLLDARVRFLEGRYGDAEAILGDLARRSPAGEVADQVGEFRDFVAPLAALEKRFTMAESEHFRIHWADPIDAVLVRRGLDALEACRAELGKDLGPLEGLGPGQKIRVEVFPDVDSFQKASTLTRGEIETSGTIALCKFNRLMMMSPRLVLRGFSWADTLCHEYTHYVLWRRNGGSVPIWLHEGVAKFEEARWSSDRGSPLSPLMEQALKGALEENRFVTFEQMHPSFAKLKNPQDVAVASAEVLSILHRIMEMGGYPLLLKMLDALKQGADWRAMFERALDQPFDQFWAEWQKWSAEKLRDVKGAARRDRPAKLVELRDPMQPAAPRSGEAGKGGEAAGPDEAEVLTSRHARLGDILRERGHLRAAALEYDRAARAGADDSHVLLNRLGLTWRAAGDLDQARQAFLRSLDAEPEYAPTLTNLGLVERERGEAASAAKWLEKAAHINPFDPRIHGALGDVYGALGLEARRSQALRDLGTLEERAGQ